MKPARPEIPTARGCRPTPAAFSLGVVLLALAAWAPTAWAQTSPEFLPEAVAYLPASPTVPSPMAFLGHLPGAEGELSTVAEIHGYLRALAAASERVEVRSLGRSEEGREMLLVLISSTDNLAQVDRWAEINRSLADPRRTNRDAARVLAQEGRGIYYLLGGLHSTETGSPEMLMELAYRLAVSEKPEIRGIRDELVVAITPVVEPDGRDRVVEWYERHLRDRDRDRDWEELRELSSPPYWGHYVFHDNNRDGMQRTQALTRAVQGAFYELRPQVVHDLHESLLGKPVTDVQWYRPWPPEEKVTWSLRNNTNYNTNYMQAGVLEALKLAARHRAELLTDAWVKADRALARGRDEAPHAWVFPLEQRDPGALAYLVRQLLDHGVEVHRLEPTTTGEASGTTASAIEAAAEASAPAGGSLEWEPGSYVVRLDQPVRDLAVTLLDRQSFPADEPNPPYDDVAWAWPLLYGVEAERVDEPSILDLPMSQVTTAPAPGGGVTGFGEDIYLLADTGQSSLLAARAFLGDWQVDAAEDAFDDNGSHYPAGSWIVQAPRSAVEEVAARYGLTFRAALSMPRVRSHLVDLPRLGLIHTWTSTQDAGWARYTLDEAGMPYALVSPDDLRRGGLGNRFDVLVFPRARGDFARLVHGIDPDVGPLAYTQTDRFPSHGIPNASPDITGGMGLVGLMELQRFVADGGVLVTLGDSGTLAVDGGLVRRVRRLPASTVRNPGSELAARVRQPRHPLAYGYEEKTSIFRGNGPLFEVPERLSGHVVVQFGDELPKQADGAGGDASVDRTQALDDSILIEDIDAFEVPVDGSASEADGIELMEGEDGDGADADSAPASGGEVEDPKRKGEGRDLVLSGWVSAPEALAGKPAILDMPTGRGRVVLFAFNPLHRHLNHSDFRFLYNALLHWNDLP